MKYLETGDASTRNELRQIEFFLENVRPGDIALDVGAHAGQYAVLLGTLAGAAGRVFSFEPDETARSFLIRNIALNKLGQRVSVEPVALSDQNGQHTFFSLGGNSMSSLARAGLGTASHSEAVSETIVRTMRLDDFVVNRGLPCPQWIKIDTEGAEILILKGAPQTLRCARGILCELHPYVWNEFGSTFDELLAIIEESGRTIRYLDPALNIADDGPVYGTVVIS
jgi:FkbM family methyltransferase